MTTVVLMTTVTLMTTAGAADKSKWQLKWPSADHAHPWVNNAQLPTALTPCPLRQISQLPHGAAVLQRCGAKQLAGAGDEAQNVTEETMLTPRSITQNSVAVHLNTADLTTPCAATSIR